MVTVTNLVVGDPNGWHYTILHAHVFTPDEVPDGPSIPIQIAPMETDEKQQ